MRKMRKRQMSARERRVAAENQEEESCIHWMK